MADIPRTTFTEMGPGNPTKAKNVLGTALQMHGLAPPTGFYRNGFCDTSQEDKGNHSIAGVMTSEFLDYSASRGNDLRKAGVTDNCRWCLCVSRWKEVVDAFRRKEVSSMAVPRVKLESSHERAVGKETGVTLELLKEFTGGKERSFEFWLAGNEGMETMIMKDEEPASQLRARGEAAKINHGNPV